MAELIKTIVEFITKYGFIQGLSLIFTLSVIYILYNKIDDILDIIRNITYKREKLLTKKDLLNHTLFSEYARLKDEMRRFNAKNLFRTTLARVYFETAIDNEITMIRHFIKTANWEKIEPNELHHEISKLISELIQNDKKNAMYIGIPEIFLDKLNHQLAPYTEQIFDNITTICANTVLNNKKYNSTKLDMLMLGIICKWNKLEKVLPVCVNGINGEFKRQNTIFRGLKDDDNV